MKKGIINLGILFLMIILVSGFVIAYTPTCSDSDGGKIYTTKGTVTGKTIYGTSYYYSDSCSSTSLLVERYCDNSSYKSVNYYCSSVGKVCSNGACVAPICTPKTCTSLGKTCGTWSDGCGKNITCGTCSTGTSCSSSGSCVAVKCEDYKLNFPCADCSGFASALSSKTSECNNQQICTWSNSRGGCSGSIPNCNAMNSSATCESIGCDYFYCSGTLDCQFFGDPDACSSAGCSWDSGNEICSGTTGDCYAIKSSSECTYYRPDCNWVSGPCKGIPTTCNAQTDVASCLTPRGSSPTPYCTWAGCTPKNCIPKCVGKYCGSDGCGGSCGSCGAGYECIQDKYCTEPESGSITSSGTSETVVCTDTDYGFSILSSGTAYGQDTSGVYKSISDYCKTSTILVEGFCSMSKVTSTEVDCVENGFKGCQNGKCTNTLDGSLRSMSFFSGFVNQIKRIFHIN